jgi:hypothetical protein
LLSKTVWAAPAILLRRADTYLSDDFVTAFSDNFAQCASSINLSARHHRLPGNAGAIVGNDPIANQPKVARLELSDELSGSHVQMISAFGRLWTRGKVRERQFVPSR